MNTEKTTPGTTEAKTQFKEFPTVIEANNNIGRIYMSTRDGAVALDELDQNIITMCEDLIMLLEGIRADIIQKHLNKE